MSMRIFVDEGVKGTEEDDEEDEDEIVDSACMFTGFDLRLVELLLP